jgi:hypothetical protein
VARRRHRPLHERVNDHVDARKLSYADVARLTGWDYLRTLRLLTGKTKLSGDDMETLADVLATPVAELYRGRSEARAS